MVRQPPGLPDLFLRPCMDHKCQQATHAPHYHTNHYFAISLLNAPRQVELLAIIIFVCRIFLFRHRQASEGLRNTKQIIITDSQNLSSSVALIAGICRCGPWRQLDIVVSLHCAVAFPVCSKVNSQLNKCQIPPHRPDPIKSADLSQTRVGDPLRPGSPTKSGRAV